MGFEGRDIDDPWADSATDTDTDSDRWDGADPATLGRVLFHLVQEYDRHLGQLDIVAELATGRAGEAVRTPLSRPLSTLMSPASIAVLPGKPGCKKISLSRA